MGETINQFNRLCYLLSYSPILIDNSDPTYSSISSLDTEEVDCEKLNAVNVPTDQMEDDEEEEDDHFFKIDNNIDHYRLCKAKTAHDSALGKIDASLAKKPLTIAEAPHLDTKVLTAKLDGVAKSVHLDDDTILSEQIKYLVLGNVGPWIRKKISPGVKSPEIQQSKGLLRYCQELDRLLIENEGQLLCYNEPSDKFDEENLRICLPLSFFLAGFRLGHFNQLGGHIRATETYSNAKRFYYWPGMFDWICTLTAACITCQSNKPKPKQRNEVPLEEWQKDTIPFRTVHVHHKGPLHPPGNLNFHCLLVIVAFSRFLMVYPVINTSAQATPAAVENGSTPLGSLNLL